MDETNPRQAKHPVQEIADAVGGEIKEMGRLPDGSGFAIMSMPLPEDHWITQPGYNVSPMPFRMGTKDRVVITRWHWWNRFVWRTVPKPVLDRQQMADRIRAAGRYAIRASTMNGKDMDFDPDAMLQNLVNGMLGYWTADGLSGFADDNPQERTQWCCDGDGKGGHQKRCRYNRNNYAASLAAQS
jgi:hypothetical protein